jgi:hypothetical protein
MAAVSLKAFIDTRTIDGAVTADELEQINKRAKMLHADQSLTEEDAETLQRLRFDISEGSVTSDDSAAFSQQVRRLDDMLEEYGLGG